MNESCFSSLLVVNCSMGPCLNEGSCRDIDNGFSCECPVEYTGTVCETGKAE